MLRRRFLATLPMAVMVPGPRTEDTVDVLLVLATDASGSLTDERITLQREGYATALESREFLRAVASGPLGRAALAAIEWSDRGRQDVTVPWTLIDDAAGARHFADTLRRAPRPIPGFTSISGAIDASVGLLARAPYQATRRVIDVSGNGANNDGRDDASARDDAVASGITVNGLPIVDMVPDLDRYYAHAVIGGPRAFLVVARDIASFAEAVRRKLVIEIAAGGASRPQG